MNATPKHVYSLCPACSQCPAVEIYEDGTVQIGEAPDIVTLRQEAWNELVRAVRNGALTEL